jgi:hypothetical protein
MNRTIFSLLLAFGLLSFAVPGAENARAQTSEAARENLYRPARVRPRIRVAPAYPYRFHHLSGAVQIRISRPGRGARLHIMACAGKPSERTGHRAEDALLVGAMMCTRMSHRVGAKLRPGG